LAAYGIPAERAKPMLETLSQDESMNEDIRLLARQAMEAINAGKTPEVRRKEVKLVTLWPLALPEAAPAPPKENSNGAVDDPRAAVQSDLTVWLLTGAGVAGLLL